MNIVKPKKTALPKDARTNRKAIATTGEPMNIELENAQELAAQNPATFHAPCLATLKRTVRTGDFVKVCARGTPGKTFAERFWVNVQSVRDGEIVGAVDNHLICQPMKAGDLITVKLEQVYDHVKQNVQ